VEWVRGGSAGFFRNYFVLKEAGEENRRLREEVGKLRMENNFLRNELSTADRAKALQVFQTRTPSRTLAANVIGVGAGSNSKTVFVNRGSTEGVLRGMAVVTPDGIVGKVIAAYPVTSEVLLVTDPEFAAGVVSQKHVRGTLKGQGSPVCKIDYVPFEDKVEPGDWFYTSGDDRVFPRGFAVGVVKSVRPGQPFKEILIEPSGLQHGVEDVLIIVSAVHQEMPDTPPGAQPVYIAPAPPGAPAPAQGTPASAAPPAGTEADKLRSIYKASGDAQGHTFGEGGPGTRPPDFTKLGTAPAGGGRGGTGAAPPPTPGSPGTPATKTPGGQPRE
jgi:rod shape-determining protein MreC